MNKTAHLLLLLLIIATGACTMMVFEEPMPLDAKEVDEFPANFQGEYIYYIDDLSAQITIGQNYFIRDSMAVYISDSLVVKAFDEGYVVNEKINDPTLKSFGKWYSYYLTESKDGALQAISFITTEPENEKKILKKYPAEIIDENEVQTLILIDAKKLNFSKLLKDKRATTVTILHPHTD